MNKKAVLSIVLIMFILTAIVFYTCSTLNATKVSKQTHGNSYVYTMYKQIHYNMLLKKYNNFRGTSNNSTKLQFDFSNENFLILKNKYELDKVAGNGNDLSKALNILYWLCKHTYHKGNYDNHVSKNSLDLLEYSFDKEDDGGLNCLNLSFILTECLLSIGLPAHTVRILPFSYKDTDNHVVTHVYIKSMEKWIMLDPTWCSYFSDTDENILNIFEIRHIFADNKDVYLNDGFSYNGQNLIKNLQEVQWYKRYMAKNLFYFDVNEISTFGQDNVGKTLYLSPESFDPFEETIKNYEYRIEFTKTDNRIDESEKTYYIEYFIERINIIKKEKTFIYLSPGDFMAAPCCL
jgi:hypothetical protein